MANQTLARLARTMLSIFRIGNINIKDSSGTIQARNAGDTAFAELAASKLRVQGSNATNYVALNAPDALGSSVEFKLPSAHGTSGFVVADTDAAGTLGFVDRVDPAGDTMTGDLTFTSASIVTADTISFNTTYIHGTESVGTMYWDTVDGTMNITLYNGSTLQSGQELHFYGKASGNIANGELCQFAGVQGDHILVKKAVAAEVIANPHYVVGVATQNITNGNYGYITWFGKVNGVYTKTPANNDSADWLAGDTLYFNNLTGQLTKTHQSPPDLDFIVAAVIKEQSGASENGIIIVRPTVRTEWNETDNRYVIVTGDTMTGALLLDGSANTVQLTVQGHSTQTANLQEWQNSAGSVLAAVDENGYIGVGIDQPAEKLHLYNSGTGAVNLLIGNSETGSAANDGFRVGITSSEDAILMHYEAKDLILGTNGAERLRIASGGNVGIGINTPAERLHVYSSGGGAVNVLIGNGDTGATGSDGFELGIDASENAMLWNFENTAMIFATNNAERMRITNSGSIGIGTNAPAERLHLYSSGTGAVNLLIGNADTGAAATDGFRVGITTGEIAILMNYENTNMEFGTNSVVRMVISAAGVVRTVGEIEIGGDLNHDGSNVGFYGSAPVAKPTVTGSRSGNAALASLLTALANLGLITNNSTP